MCLKERARALYAVFLNELRSGSLNRFASEFAIVLLCGELVALRPRQTLFMRDWQQEIQ